MVVARNLHAPGAPMNVDMHGCFRCLCLKNVEPFDGGRAVGKALGGADAFTYQFAIARAPLDNHLEVRRVRCTAYRRRPTPSGPCPATRADPWRVELPLVVQMPRRPLASSRPRQRPWLD